MAREQQYPVKKVIAFDQALLDKIDDWRRRQKPIPSASDAIRVLILMGVHSGMQIDWERRQSAEKEERNARRRARRAEKSGGD